MAPASGAGQPFRLSMLIHDRHYRALLIQALVFILVMSLAAWLVNNTVQNLARMGKTFDFGFLFNRSGYDIPFSLIPYDSNSTHLRAAIAQYAGAALAAFEEVETALDSGVVLRRRRDAAAIRVREIEEALRIEDLRYRIGESSLLDVLQIRQQAITARSDLATIERMEREQFVTLNLALGGSWNAPEADPPEISEKDGDANP